MTPRGYRSFADHVASWQSLADRGARRELCGQSVLGRPITALEIGPAKAPKLSIAMAGIHPIEWIGVEVLARWLEALIENPPADRRVLVFPLVNVDGFTRVEQDLSRGARRFRRGNANGVDLNRNFPTHFKKLSLVKRMLPWTFRRGTAPLSEPEPRAVTERIDRAIRQGATDLRAISLHSFGAKVLFPYGGVWRKTQDHKALRRHAEALARPIGYRAVQSSHWVPGFFAPGMELDHLYEAFGATALLVECSRGGFMLRRPSTWLSPFQWFNPPDPRQTMDDLVPALGDFLIPRGG
jgi:predicted deacylase